MKYRGMLASSSDPSGETLSKTVEGVIIGASSLIIFAGLHFFNITVTANDVATLATEVGAIAGAIVTLYGLLKKLVNAVGTV